MNVQHQLISAGLSAAASKEASGIAASLASFLNGIPLPLRPAAVEFIMTESLRQTASEPIDPAILDWVRQHCDLEEAAANLRDIQENGGFQLADFDAELERIAVGQS